MMLSALDDRSPAAIGDFPTSTRTPRGTESPMHVTESDIHRLYARLLEVFERKATIWLMRGLMPGWPSSIVPDPRLVDNLSRGDDAGRRKMYTELAAVIGHPEVD